MKTVRAKFICSAKESNNDETGTNVHMHPVYTGCEENKAFNDATPGGSLHLHIAPGKEAADQFEVGQEYYLDITKAE